MVVERVGIIGLGHIGKFHIKALQQYDELQLLAVCDRRREFEYLAPSYVDFYTDYEMLLDDDRIETVIIATPNHTHYLIARKVLEAGKNVILEKPAAESMSELVQLQKSAENAGLFIYYAFHAASAFDVNWFVQYYNMPDIREELGRVTAFYSRFYDPYVENGQLLTEAEGLQDCWFDSGINAISVIQRIIDLDKVEIENVSAAINHAAIPRFLQCHAGFSFSIDGEDQAGIGVIDTNWTTSRNHKSTVLTFGETRNYVRIDHSAQKVIRRKSDGSEIELTNLSAGRNRLYNHYLGVFEHFIECRKLDEMNDKFALKAHRLLFDTERLINEKL